MFLVFISILGVLLDRSVFLLVVTTHKEKLAHRTLCLYSQVLFRVIRAVNEGERKLIKWLSPDC